MSHRRVSLKELGQVDCQGWLYKKKEGKGFLGTKWKKYWFVLKKTALYWYTGQTAEKAEGYIHLSDFTVDQATECKKKHAIKASHPQVVTLYFAAERLSEMNKWLSKLSAAVAAALKESSEGNTGECYSEESDQEVESLETSDPEQLTIDSVSGDVPPSCSTSSPCHSTGPVSAPDSIVTSESMQSWLDVPSAERAVGQGAPLHPLRLDEEDGPGAEAQGGKEEGTSDEMEALYIHLKHARLSPTGELKRDFRASFIQRCKNDQVNNKLHLVRTLNSTLKAKEADLLAIEHVLADPILTAQRYRQWRVGNVALLQEITNRKKDPPGGSREQSFPLGAPRTHCIADTSA
ncbi:interactor protein for cytohesin exchange factors 1 isoform X1 [Coregonus clupeaformis]|uniref:interactor protein for cytohesin exchange factors 1 isoform X1 n=1 Tax=Coregonus clupeaformis TaxID=59861 RepID=UPI001BDFF21D|nr:interactor protein for cytohesin exchange factors 1 isoform X1 [Coregonus clupeaformis]